MFLAQGDQPPDLLAVHPNASSASWVARERITDPVKFEPQRGVSPAGLRGSASFGVGDGRGGVEDCGSGRLLRGGGLIPPGSGRTGAFASGAGGGGAVSGMLRRRASASRRCSLRGASSTSLWRAFRSALRSPRL